MDDKGNPLNHLLVATRRCGGEGALSLRGRMVRTMYALSIHESPSRAADILVFALIFIFGAFAFVFYQHSSDFLQEDVFFADCARSLLQHGFYGLSGRPETTQPPGLSAILAMLFLIFGYGHAICLHAMAVFETLGFGITYAVLRRHLPRSVAAGICVLLISSPIYFEWATRMVVPAIPLLFTTMTALLAFENCESASTSLRRSFWGIVLTSMVVASLMIASAAMALLGAIIAVIVITFFTDRRFAMVRVWRFAPVLLIGFLVLGIWMQRKPAAMEWVLPGFPAPYLDQLKVKLGNYPELGLATPRDIPARILTNFFDQTDHLAQAVLRHGISPSKMWVIIIPCLLIAIGWTHSVWQGGGGLPAWYFAAYELVYLLWPWKFEARFLLPIAPLACLFFWKGVQALHVAATTKPRAFGIIGSPLGALLAISGFRYSGVGRYPDVLIAPLLVVFAVCAGLMALSGQHLSFLLPASQVGKWLRSPLRLWHVTPLRLSQYASRTAVVVLVLVGVNFQAGIAQENIRVPDPLLTHDTSVNSMALEVESALWIRSHTPAASVIMARHLPIVYHYAERQMVWFAPISNPDVLMEGIISHKVNYVIVIKHSVPYYLPDDDYCFDRLLAKYGDGFRMAFQDSNLRIFRVDRTGNIT